MVNFIYDNIPMMLHRFMTYADEENETEPERPKKKAKMADGNSPSKTGGPCQMCEATTSPQWRRGGTLCNKCGLNAGPSPKSEKKPAKKEKAKSAEKPAKKKNVKKDKEVEDEKGERKGS